MAKSAASLSLVWLLETIHTVVLFKNNGPGYLSNSGDLKTVKNNSVRVPHWLFTRQVATTCLLHKMSHGRNFKIHIICRNLGSLRNCKLRQNRRSVRRSKKRYLHTHKIHGKLKTELGLKGIKTSMLHSVQPHLIPSSWEIIYRNSLVPFLKQCVHYDTTFYTSSISNLVGTKALNLL